MPVVLVLIKRKMGRSRLCSVFLVINVSMLVIVVGGSSTNSSSSSSSFSAKESGKSLVPSQQVPIVANNAITQEKATSRQARDYTPPGQGQGGYSTMNDVGSAAAASTSYGAPQAMSGGYSGGGGGGGGGGYGSPQYAIPPIVLVRIIIKFK